MEYSCHAPSCGHTSDHISDVVSGRLFLSLHYLFLCVMSGADTMLVEAEDSARFWNKKRNCPVGLAGHVSQTLEGQRSCCTLAKNWPGDWPCLCKAWQMSLLMGAWTLGCSPGQRVEFIFSTVHLS